MRNPHCQRMFPSWGIIIVLIMVLVATPAFAQKLSIDLRKIGHISKEGRVQDKDKNPSLPVVDSLIAHGADAIPFLLVKLEDSTVIRGKVLDDWPRVRVGDVAWFILYDFFTDSHMAATLPDPGLFAIVGSADQNQPGWKSWASLVKRCGRKGIRKAAEVILKPYEGKFLWNPAERCFIVTQ
ncbi:MAG TPA: hypothetical protein VLX68_13120 [Chitinivibrionales bacterium]|nr:hypothetical protein [Chitinivibrionales bacterium]